MDTEKTHNAKIIQLTSKNINPFNSLKSLLLDLEDMERKIRDQFNQENKAYQ